MMSFLFVSILVLHFFLGSAEIGGEEEITKFLYDYASHFGDYLYATIEYYDNTTIIPTMYSYEEVLESVGSPLQCHIPLVILLSLLGLLL